MHFYLMHCLNDNALFGGLIPDIVLYLLTFLACLAQRCVSRLPLLGPRFDSGVPVYLAPWAACPPGVKLPLGSLPPRGEDTPGYLAPTLGSLRPGGEAASGQLAPPRG